MATITMELFEKPPEAITFLLGEILLERLDQLGKWGDQRHEPFMWLAILAEEVGEVARELAESRLKPLDTDHLRRELIQVAAVAVAAIEAIDKQEGE